MSGEPMPMPVPELWVERTAGADDVGEADESGRADGAVAGESIWQEGEQRRPGTRGPARASTAGDQVPRDEALRDRVARDEGPGDEALGDRAARDHADRGRVLRDRVSRDLAAQDEALRDRVARDRIARDQAARDQVLRDQGPRDGALRDRAAREQTHRDRAARGHVPRDQAARRRGPADPVRSVIYHHREMIAGAVDVWEIAAGLEARGVTDADARRWRHRDVFGLAEELYARVPRAVRVVDAGGAHRERPWARPATAGLYLLPGVVCGVAAAVLAQFPHLAALGALPTVLPAALAVAAAWAVLRRGPLRAERGPGAFWVWVLLAGTLHGPAGWGARADAGPGTTACAALALSLAPAAYCAHWFAVRARAQLAPSHGLSEFADAVRPRLAAALTAYLLGLLLLLTAATVLVGPAPVAAPAALGLLLFTARLLAVHGHPRPAATALAATCAAEALARTPFSLPLSLSLTCTIAALALATHAFRVLPRASAHRGPTRI